MENEMSFQEVEKSFSLLGHSTRNHPFRKNGKEKKAAISPTVTFSVFKKIKFIVLLKT
jgi:hypothetical protein